MLVRARADDRAHDRRWCMCRVLSYHVVSQVAVTRHSCIVTKWTGRRLGGGAVLVSRRRHERRRRRACAAPQQRWCQREACRHVLRRQPRWTGDARRVTAAVRAAGRWRHGVHGAGRLSPSHIEFSPSTHVAAKRRQRAERTTRGRAGVGVAAGGTSIARRQEAGTVCSPCHLSTAASDALPARRPALSAKLALCMG